MRRRQDHEVYELVTSEWPNGRPRTGILTFSHVHALSWEKAGGRVEHLAHADHMPDEQSAEVRRRDVTAKLLRELEQYKQERGASPSRLSPAEARAAVSELGTYPPERLRELHGLVGALEDGES